MLDYAMRPPASFARLSATERRVARSELKRAIERRRMGVVWLDRSLSTPQSLEIVAGGVRELRRDRKHDETERGSNCRRPTRVRDQPPIEGHRLQLRALDTAPLASFMQVDCALSVAVMLFEKAAER